MDMRLKLEENEPNQTEIRQDHKSLYTTEFIEENLEAITRTIEQLKRDGCKDEEVLNDLRQQRDKILKDLNL